MNFWPEVGINFELIFGLGNGNINFVMIGPAKCLPRKVLFFCCTLAHYNYYSLWSLILMIQCHLSDLIRETYGYETIPPPVPPPSPVLHCAYETMYSCLSTFDKKHCFVARYLLEIWVGNCENVSRLVKNEKYLPVCCSLAITLVLFTLAM